jgi:hypothetical protein
MIFINAKRDGTVTTTPQFMPQGSSMSDIVVLSEFDYAYCAIKLTPASGVYIPDVPCNMVINSDGKVLWTASLPPEAATVPGKVNYSLIFTAADGTQQGTLEGYFTVPRGAVTNMPETAGELAEKTIADLYAILGDVFAKFTGHDGEISSIQSRLPELAREVQLSTLTIQKTQWEDSNPTQAFGNVSGLFAFTDTTASRKVSILLLPVDNATRVESRSIGIEVTNVTPMTGIGDVTIFFSREGEAPAMDLKYVVIAFSEPNETGEAFTVSAGFVGIGASSTDQLEADVEALKQQTGEAITKHDEDIDEIYGELQNLEAIAGTNVQAISDIREILKGMGGGPNQDEEQNQKLQQLESNYGELKSVVDELLYVPISIDEFKSSVTSAEKGSTVTETTLSWVLNKDPEAVSLDGVALEPLESADYTLRDLAITANKKFTLSATDGKKTVTKDASINFYNGVYYGAATVPEAYNSAFMIALGKSGKKVLRGSKLTSFTVTAGAGEYIYYCLPVSMGACSFKVGGFDGGFDLVATLAYTNEYGHTEQYYIYRSANAGLGETNVEVK